MLKACDACAIITHCTDSEDLQGKMGRREGTGREGKGRKKGHNTLKYTAGSRTLVDVMKNSNAHTGGEVNGHLSQLTLSVMSSQRTVIEHTTTVLCFYTYGPRLARTGSDATVTPAGAGVYRRNIRPLRHATNDARTGPR